MAKQPLELLSAANECLLEVELLLEAMRRE